MYLKIDFLKTPALYRDLMAIQNREQTLMKRHDHCFDCAYLMLRIPAHGAHSMRDRHQQEEAYK